MPQRAPMNRALAWLETSAPNSKQPWTLAINIVKPHFPHNVTQDLWDMYADHADLPRYGGDAGSGRHPYCARSAAVLRYGHLQRGPDPQPSARLLRLRNVGGPATGA